MSQSFVDGVWMSQLFVDGVWMSQSFVDGVWMFQSFVDWCMFPWFRTCLNDSLIQSIAFVERVSMSQSFMWHDFLMGVSIWCNTLGVSIWCNTLDACFNMLLMRVSICCHLNIESYDTIHVSMSQSFMSHDFSIHVPSALHPHTPFIDACSQCLSSASYRGA